MVRIPRISELVQAFPQAQAEKFHNIGHDTKNMVTLIGALCTSSGRVTPDSIQVQPVHSQGASRVDQLDAFF